MSKQLDDYANHGGKGIESIQTFSHKCIQNVPTGDYSSGEQRNSGWAKIEEGNHGMPKNTRMAYQMGGTRSLIPRQTAACSGPVDGDINQNSSTRAELFGIASALKFLLEFIKFHKTDTSSGVTIWTDSAASLARVRFLSWSKHTGRPPANADIVSLLAELIHTLLIAAEVTWIKLRRKQGTTGGLGQPIRSL